MEQLYLTECVYEEEKQRIISYFSKDPYSNKYDFVYKEKFNPYFYIDLPKEIVQKLLSDFRKEIKVEKIEQNKIKVIAKNKETLNKIYKILSISTSKNILILDIEREYLIEKEWSYYDLFIIISKTKIKKIENNNISAIVKKYINPFLKEEQLKLIENLTKKLLLSNILKIKIKNINNQEILNNFFENLYFENKMMLNNKISIEYLEKEKNIKQGIKMDFSNIWPYLLTKDFYNIGHDTLNCDCCKPKNYLDINVLSNSIVKVRFKKQGFYFISKDQNWAYEQFHKNNLNKENRLNFKKNNGLKEMPTGPFYKGDFANIPLIDAINLVSEEEIEIIDDLKEIKWYCLKKESFLSLKIKEYLKRLKHLETSINLSNSFNYNYSFKNNLDKNPMFIQYLTEYKLINDLIEEIPKFIEHKNTKFYDSLLAQSIKYLKLETIKKIDINENKYLIDKEKVIVKEKKIIEKINNYFPQLNLPIPKLIVN
jgi:hypothetical protein